MVTNNSKDSLEKDGDILVDCAWVTGYSSISTLVIIFNSILFFSVGKNSYLHYSTHYTVLVLAVRNILYTIVCTCILLLTKIEDTPWMLKLFHIQTDQESGLLCEVLSCLDCLLSSLIMFYLLGLAVHMLCRGPNPSLFRESHSTLKMYGLNSKAKPVRESTWQAPLLLLLPLLCALLLSLPVPLLHLPHPLSALPGTEICSAPLNITYQTSIATLSALLPVTTLMILLLGLSLRRCLSCTGGECISSYCKEEIFLGMMIFPYSLVSIGKNLPLLDIHLERIGMEEIGAQDYLNSAVLRAAEACLGLLLPILAYCLLPPYRKFSSQPDSSDLYQSKRDIYRQSLTPGERLSQVSVDSV